MKKYEPYRPTKWEQRIDSLLGLASTKVALSRMINRERMHWFRYLAAQPTSARPNAPSSTAGEWLRIQREKMQVMWNAIDMVDNSGLCSGIITKFPTYVCGTLRWQARTGDKNVNTAYQQYIQQKTGKPTNIDITGRASLRQQCMLDIKSIMLKGDVGTNIIRDTDDELYLQGIEANRIGDPYRWQTSDTYVRGLSLDSRTGRIVSVRVYYQDRRSGTYKLDNEYPTRDERGLPKFLFFTNPLSYDDYRGVSLFKHAIDNATYIDRMRQYELQALLWAASQSGVYYTKSGALPEQLPFSRTPVVDKDGNTIETFETRPNTLVALSADGEKVEMFQHDRPSPNVIGMYENTITDISVGAGLTKQFTWGMTGTGPEVRMASAQDARAVEMWQQMLRESKLDNVVMLLLGDAIAKGDLPYHENWLTWDWYFPAKPTIDVGRESEANIEEIQAGLNTGANVVSESGQGDIEDVIIQRGHEVGMMIDAAQEEAKERGLDWEQVYALMIPPPKGRGGGGGGGMAGAAGVAGDKVAGQNPDKKGASDEGVEIDGGNGNGNGSGKGRSSRFRMNDDGSITIFYRPDQARGEAGTPEGGQFVPEGGGAGGGEGGGTAVATQKKTETQAVPQLTGLDKKIVDYKPKERSLTDPAKLTPIADTIPNTRYVPYSKQPFFDALNRIQGVDPNKVSGLEYKKSRDDFFGKLPVTDIPLDSLAVTQPGVNKDKVAELMKKPLDLPVHTLPSGEQKLVHAVRYKGETYILNGHHRIIHAVLKGGETIKGNLFDLGDKELDDNEIETYRKSAQVRPELTKLVTDVAAAHHGDAVVAPLKSLPRARAKVQADYGGDWSKIKDVTRSRILADSDGDVEAIVADLSKRLGMKPKLPPPEAQQVGFKDYKFNPEIGGQKVEISVMTDHMAAMTEATHGPYEKWQAIQRNAVNERRNLTEDEVAKTTMLNNQMAEIFKRSNHA